MTDIMAGDTVKCLVDYYKSYAYGELAKVKRLDLSSAGNPVLILENYLCDYGESMYSLDNWAFHSRPEPKKETNMSYVRSQYFALKLDNTKEGSFMPVKIETGDAGEPFNEQTVNRHTKSEVIRDVRSVIKEGETWVLVKTEGFISPAEPKPVLKDVQITECR
jgi:hypothetical protein